MGGGRLQLEKLKIFLQCSTATRVEMHVTSALKKGNILGHASSCVKKVFLRYYWLGCEKYVRQKTQECIHCAHKNNVKIWPAEIPPLQPIPVTPKAFWRVHCDLFGPLKKSSAGNRYVGIAVCALTKYVEAMRKSFTILLQNIFVDSMCMIQISDNIVVGDLD